MFCLYEVKYFEKNAQDNNNFIVFVNFILNCEHFLTVLYSVIIHIMQCLFTFIYYIYYNYYKTKSNINSFIQMI